MDWERVASARRWGRLMLGIPWLALGFVVFFWVAAPSQQWQGSNRPDNAGGLLGLIDHVTLVGALGFVSGYVWMWKLYRAPTRFEGAHWRFHDS
jgi:hypothetical protein